MGAPILWTTWLHDFVLLWSINLCLVIALEFLKTEQSQWMWRWTTRDFTKGSVINAPNIKTEAARSNGMSFGVQRLEWGGGVHVNFLCSTVVVTVVVVVVVEA